MTMPTALEGTIPYAHVRLILTAEGPGDQMAMTFDVATQPQPLSAVDAGDCFLFSAHDAPEETGVTGAVHLVPWRKVDDSTIENVFSGHTESITDPGQQVYLATRIA